MKGEHAVIIYIDFSKVFLYSISLLFKIKNFGISKKKS